MRLSHVVFSHFLFVLPKYLDTDIIMVTCVPGPCLLSSLMVGMLIFTLEYKKVILCCHMLVLAYPKELFPKALLSFSKDLAREVPVQSLYLLRATNK